MPFFSFLYENQLESIRLTKTDVSGCRHSESQTNIVSAMNVEVCAVLKYLNMDSKCDFAILSPNKRKPPNQAQLT